MSDKEKFEAFKKNLVEENDKKYGEEVKEMYGEESVNYANNRILKMTEEEHKNIEELSKLLNDSLKSAAEIGDPNSELARTVVKLHKEQLSFFMDSPICDDTQLALAEMHVADSRFSAYYDNIYTGSAVFLRDSIKTTWINNYKGN